MKIIWNNKLFPSLNFIYYKTSPYASKVILRHYHYRYDPKYGPGSVVNRIITCSCHAFTTILSLYWGYKIKEAVNNPRYGSDYNCKCSQIIGCRNNWILMNSLDDRTYEEYYENMNRTILDGNMMNIYLIVMEVKYGAIDTEDYSCHGYYIIKFSSST